MTMGSVVPLIVTDTIVLSRRNVETFDISVDDHAISRDNTLKMLGVTLDD